MASCDDSAHVWSCFSFLSFFLSSCKLPGSSRVVLVGLVCSRLYYPLWHAKLTDVLPCRCQFVCFAVCELGSGEGIWFRTRICVTGEGTDGRLHRVRRHGPIHTFGIRVVFESFLVLMTVPVFGQRDVVDASLRSSRDASDTPHDADTLSVQAVLPSA